MGRHSSDHAVPHKVPPLFQEQTGGTEEVEGREVVGIGGNRERRVEEEVRGSSDGSAGDECEFDALFYCGRGASMFVRLIKY